MELDEYLTARNKSMIEMDFDFVRNQIGRNASDQMCELTLHKARYECKTIPPEFRHSSGAWLREHGYSRMTGEPVLPEGELPV